MKNYTCVLALAMFYETRQNNENIYFRLLYCVIYAIIKNYVCINYIVFRYKKSSVICMDKKYVSNFFNKFMGIGIPDLLMNLFMCHGFMKNINPTVVPLCSSRM